MKTKTLLQKLALEVFYSGKPLVAAVNELVEIQYNQTLNKAKTLVREGQDFVAVRGALVADGLPPQSATSITHEAGLRVATEIANENQLKKATETAQELFKNGNRLDSVVSHLRADGCSLDLSERVAKENQHFYR